MKCFIFLLIINFMTMTKSLGQDDLTQLRSLLRQHQVSALQMRQYVNRSLYQLGKKLFSENLISGNKNISCQTCHHPNWFSGDALPLPIGEGGELEGRNRRMGTGHVIPRNSNPLFNLGHRKMHTMFWDGRVQYNASLKTLTTPEKGLNGPNPKRPEYARVLNSALAAQAMFPPTSHEEMRGQPGANDLADAKTNFEVWERIMDRLMELEEYQELFSRAYPSVKEFNFAHAAKAIAEFERIKFYAPYTPFDRFMRGADNALTDQEKRGAILFYSKAKCVECHSGSLMTNQEFHNVAFPQMGPGKESNRDDRGRFLVSNKASDRFRFRTPPLRNVALTAPYGHAGTFKTLREVLEHYRNPHRSLMHYRPHFNVPYRTEVYRTSNHNKMHSIDPIIGKGIDLTDAEAEDLLTFLVHGLTSRN